jgi:hypothetical protein
LVDLSIRRIDGHVRREKYPHDPSRASGSTSPVANPDPHFQQRIEAESGGCLDGAGGQVGLRLLGRVGILGIAVPTAAPE